MAFKPSVDTKEFKPPESLATREQKKLTATAASELISLEEERIYREGVVSIRDLIAPAAFDVQSHFIQIGNIFCRTIFISSYPRYISIGWASPVINLSVTMDIAMFFYPVKSEIILKQLRNKVGALEAQITADTEKGAPRDPIRETALRDVEKLRDDLTQGTEHFFQFAFYVTVYSESKEKLDKVSADIESIFGGKLIGSRKVLFQAEQGFNSTLPLGIDELMISFNMNSSPIAASFPFISAELTSDSGILYGINRHNNSLILFDRFSLQNANMSVFATSGAGKSYAVKLEVLRTMMMGTDVIVIDPEMEYKHLSDAVGGTYINISLSSESKINPFDLPRPVGKSISVDDVIRGAVITMKGLLRIIFGGLSTSQDSLVDRALIETYAKKDITADSDLSTVKPPLMQDLQEILEGMEGSEDLFYAEKLALELGAEFIPRIIKEDEIENIMRKLKQIGIYGYNVIIGVGEYTTMEKARESGITHIFNGLGSDELFFGFNMHRQIPFDELEDFRERRLSYLGAIDLDRVYRIAENFGISVHFPYLSDGVVNAALNTPIEKNEEIYDKKPLRSIAMDLGLSSFIAGRKKRAFQYGTGVVKYLEKLAKKEKYENVGELIKRI